MGKKEILLTEPHEEYPVTLTINPRRLVNTGQLYTTQNFVDQGKLLRALQGVIDPNNDKSIPPQGFFWKERKAIVLGNGNHRTAVAYLKGETVEVQIIGPFDTSKRCIPFNVFIRNYLSGMGLED